MLGFIFLCVGIKVCSRRNPPDGQHPVDNARSSQGWRSLHPKTDPEAKSPVVVFKSENMHFSGRYGCDTETTSAPCVKLFFGCGFLGQSCLLTHLTSSRLLGRFLATQQAGTDPRFRSAQTQNSEVKHWERSPMEIVASRSPSRFAENAMLSLKKRRLIGTCCDIWPLRDHYSLICATSISVPVGRFLHTCWNWRNQTGNRISKKRKSISWLVNQMTESPLFDWFSSLGCQKTVPECVWSTRQSSLNKTLTLSRLHTQGQFWHPQEMFTLTRPPHCVVKEDYSCTVSPRTADSEWLCTFLAISSAGNVAPSSVSPFLLGLQLKTGWGGQSPKHTGDERKFVPN